MGISYASEADIEAGGRTVSVRAKPGEVEAKLASQQQGVTEADLNLAQVHLHQVLLKTAQNLKAAGCNCEEVNGEVVKTTASVEQLAKSLQEAGGEISYDPKSTTAIAQNSASPKHKGRR